MAVVVFVGGTSDWIDWLSSLLMLLFHSAPWKSGPLERRPLRVVKCLSCHVDVGVGTTGAWVLLVTVGILGGGGLLSLVGKGGGEEIERESL